MVEHPAGVAHGPGQVEGFVHGIGVEGNDLTKRLGEDPAFPLSQAALDALLTSPLDFVGDARRQSREIARRIDEVVAAHPEASAYIPEPIL